MTDEVDNEEDLWASAAEDLDKQRDMLKEAAAQDGEAGGSDDTGGFDDDDAEEDIDAGRYKRILDIPLTMAVELGSAKMLINDLLQLGQGSVIELTKLVGEPLDIMVNEKLVAKGEVVVVNEKFGVRLTEVSSQQKRIENLG